MYLDLFDDGLYSSQFEGDPKYDALKNHIRVACFVHFMFGYGPLRVPEQWAVSSAACIDVLAEVVEGYALHVKSSAPHPPLRIPVVFACFGRDSDIVGHPSIEHALAAAFWERCHKSKRIRTSQYIDTEGSSRLDKSRVTSLFAGACHDGHFSYSNSRFKENLSRILGDRGRAYAISRLFEYAHDSGAVDRVSWETYHTSSRRFSHRLFEHIRSTEPTDLGRRFRGAFEQAETDGIPLHRVVELLRVWREQDPADEVKFLHIMRLGMHTALAECVGSPSYSFAYDAYEADDLSSANALLNAMKLREFAKKPHEAFEERAVFEILTQRASQSNLGAFAVWSETWRAIFDLRNSEHFRQTRKAIRRAGAQYARQEAAVLPELVDEFVMRIADTIRDFEAHRTPGNGLLVGVSRRRANLGGLENTHNLIDKGAALVKGGELLGGIVAPLGFLLAIMKILDRREPTDGAESRNASLFVRKRNIETAE